MYNESLKKYDTGLNRFSEYCNRLLDKHIFSSFIMFDGKRSMKYFYHIMSFHYLYHRTFCIFPF